MSFDTMCRHIMRFQSPLWFEIVPNASRYKCTFNVPLPLSMQLNMVSTMRNPVFCIGLPNTYKGSKSFIDFGLSKTEVESIWCLHKMRCFGSMQNNVVGNVNKNASKTSDLLYGAFKLMRCHTLMPVVILGMPVMWSAVAALPNIVGVEELKKIGLLALGCFFTRTSGCCVNDMADMKLDSHVARTKTRPLACGQLTVSQALGVLAGNASIALCILLQFDQTTIKFGCLAATLACIYPFTKRFINYPQLFLGASFNVGTLMAWTAITGGNLAIAPFCLYVCGTFWTMIYDTVYAHQDKKYDIAMGMKSLAIHWGDDCKKKFTILAYNMSFLLTSFGYLQHLGDPYYASVVISHLYMLREIKNVNLENPASCFSFFKNSSIYGTIILAGILAGKGLTLDLTRTATI
ncbi:bifunctional Prenyltransferase/4-hydroxybenzoate polyprenyltransferase-like/UbiA prenyltransferase family/UbiA prenyltransferase conserved site/UbiA prenyltransferase superfamily [Babesia duncani]|uniref:4-hydroxybenzoate polyprenyltransferase, mitochondrial n=1 Tax=Babesia duncani TaxID=323732 RepID=A0AAD9PJJ6_9APIC|nr:bifunctional Prenyltransferase/4-hydroxybenzoate polyprenyltransferase-like/UbiA prenyltransferase family/UbiA prenyltransferase conserved site/UbiA prenyltransferase superfamily [Babesia duncani]